MQAWQNTIFSAITGRKASDKSRKKAFEFPKKKQAKCPLPSWNRRPNQHCMSPEHTVSIEAEKGIIYFLATQIFVKSYFVDTEHMLCIVQKFQA